MIFMIILVHFYPEPINGRDFSQAFFSRAVGIGSACGFCETSTLFLDLKLETDCTMTDWFYFIMVAIQSVSFQFQKSISVKSYVRVQFFFHLGCAACFLCIHKMFLIIDGS